MAEQRMTDVEARTLGERLQDFARTLPVEEERFLRRIVIRGVLGSADVTGYEYVHDFDLGDDALDYSSVTIDHFLGGFTASTLR